MKQFINQSIKSEILTDSTGSKKTGRRITVQSVFDCTPEKAWKKEQYVATLLEITSPLVKFKPLKGKPFPKFWSSGIRLQLKMFLYGFIPFGGIRTLHIEEVNHEHKYIQSREKDAVIKVWDHKLSFEKYGNNQTLYTDSIILYAGILTVPIAIWSLFFNKHRQMKWKTIAKNLF